MWSCRQSLVTLAFLWKKLSELQFYKDLTRRNSFLRNSLDLSEKRVKTKSLKVLRANSYVCRSYRRKTGRGRVFFPQLSCLKIKHRIRCTTWSTSIDLVLTILFIAATADELSVWPKMWILWKLLHKSFNPDNAALSSQIFMCCCAIDATHPAKEE